MVRGWLHCSAMLENIFKSWSCFELDMSTSRCRNRLIVTAWGAQKTNILGKSPVSKFTNIQSICDDVIIWNHFPRYWPFVRGIHRSPVNSPHKGQWRGALMFSLICAWINRWVNSRKAGDLGRYRAHYGVIVMMTSSTVRIRLLFVVMLLQIDALFHFPQWPKRGHQDMILKSELTFTKMCKARIKYIRFMGGGGGFFAFSVISPHFDGEYSWNFSHGQRPVHPPYSMLLTSPGHQHLVGVPGLSTVWLA